MLRENKKEAAQIEQPNKDSNKNSVADELDEMCRKLQRAADPTYLDSFTMEELYDQVFESRPSIIEGLLLRMTSGDCRQDCTVWWGRYLQTSFT